MNRCIKWDLTHRKASVGLVLACAGWFLLLVSAGAAESQSLRGHVPAPVAHLKPVGQFPASQSLNLAISLPLRNREALTNLLHDLYDPASPNLRRFLTPAQFAEQFGPSEADYQALKAFVAAHGFTVTATHPNRAVLSVRGGAAEIEKAFHVTLRLYQHPKEARKFYAPDTEPSLDLSVPVLHISGLDDYQLPRPMMVKRPANQPADMQPQNGSAPGGAYMGDDFRAAYVPGTWLTGAGQTVGLLQFDGFFQSDIASYESLTGRPNVPITIVPIDGGVSTPGSGVGEVSLDIEMVISMASSISHIYVYEAPNPSPWVDILSRMANDNLSRQLSCSWGGGPPEPAGDQIFLQMAAQGQSFFNASGDSDAFVAGDITFPAESPYIMEVGGTTLTTTGPGGAWQSEKVWNWGGGEGSSGGISTNYAIPTWQQGIDMTNNQGSTTMRNIPDVALTADNVYVIYGDGQTGVFGGTSCAAPLWAGFTSLINQQAAFTSQAPVGFLNPALYAIGKGSTYRACFHDIIVGDNTWSGSSNLFFAVPGYDLCTGWGTPTGTNLINSLVAPAQMPVLVVVSNAISGGNGNGLIDYDECNDLTLTLANVGNAVASGITATLSTTTPGAAIALANSPYPNISGGGSATNTVLFKISTSPSFVCGRPIDCSLLLQFDQGVSAYKFSLPTGVPGASQRFDSSSVVTIPSPGFTNSAIAVSGVAFPLSKVQVSLFVTEALDSALGLELIAPDGTTCILSTNNGASGQNYGVACTPESLRTTFDDAALTPIGSGSAPFVGAFQPAQPLAVFIGKFGANVNGTWQLRATDQGLSDISAIQCWSLSLVPASCTEGGGQCPGADMAVSMTVQPSPAYVENNLTYTIVVNNLGPSSTTNVVVTQLLPGSVSVVSVSPSQGTYSVQGSLIAFNVGPMAARATATLIVNVLPTAAGTLYSSVTVTSEQPDPNPINNTAIVPAQVNPATTDLAVGIAASPSPVLIDTTLTYTVSLTNNGPSPATLITVTNVLPVSAPILSATFSRGTATYAGNVIFWSLPSLAKGATATATIAVTPTAQGLITATASVEAHEFDPVTVNDTATVTTTVGPAADLALSLTGFPNPVVAGSNVTYTVTVTNRGPSTATGVIVSDLLPAAVTVVSTNASQGTVSIAGGTLTWNLGTMTNGGQATLTIVVHTTINATLTTTATVAASQADPNPANNSVTVTTQVTPPGVALAAAGATLTAESFSPPDGAIENGETVTLILRLRNVSNVTTLNLVGTLLATNGVTPAAPTSQTYGVLAPSGFPVGRAFTFTANGTNGQIIRATLQLQDGTNTYPPVSFAFTLPTTQTFANSNTILVPDPAAPNPPYPVGSGPATPYPSVVNVSGFAGVLGKVTVTLSNLNHTFPRDVNALLVAPSGAKALVMSHAGDEPVAGLNLTFDDSAAGPLPATGQLVSGLWQPTAYSPAPQLGGFPATAPAGPYAALLAALNGGNPIGAWSLYVFDDSSGDMGAISNGWSLALTSISPVNQIADLGLAGVAMPNPVLMGGTLTYIFGITNGGPNAATSVAFTNVLPAGVTLISASASQGNVLTSSTSVVVNLETLNAGAIATVTNVVAVTTAAIPPGMTSAALTSLANVAANETDLNPVNNSAAVVATVNRPVADLGLTQTVAPDPVVVGYSLTNTVVLTNRGPGTGLSAVLMEPLPPAAGFVAASSSSTVGTIASVGGVITCSLGDFAPNATATVILVLTNSAAGFMTNAVSLSTASTDPVSNNNSATYVATVVNPSPQITNAGAVLTYESGPVNGAVDPGETVTLSLSLVNIGSLGTVNLKATLLPTGGVTAPSGPQYYGALVPGGPSAARSFTFTSAAAPGGVTVATLQLQDQSLGANTPTVVFTFPAPVGSSFSSGSPIVIPDHGTGVPYPSTVNVSGLTGQVTKATVTLNGFVHQFPHDVDVLLLSPSGTNVLVMSHTGGGYAVNNLTLTFDDAAKTSLPNWNPLTSGTNQPSVYEGPIALPGTGSYTLYQYALSAVNGSDPNGPWSLYVFDDTVGDSGEIASGWTLGLTTAETMPTISVPTTLSGVFTNSHFQVTVTCQPGFVYVLQGSTDLTSWASLTTNTNTTGTFTFTDATTPALQQRYYRTVRP